MIQFCIVFLILGSACTLTLLVVKGFEIVAFRMEGLAGSASNATWRNFNLMTAPLDMPKDNSEVVGTKLLSLLHVTLLVIVPIGLVLWAIMLWFVPMNLKSQRRYLSLFPFWNSWCSLDVFFMTSMASLLEMHLIAQFVFDKQFPMICNNLEKFNVACVRLGHEMGPGFHILIGCTALYMLLTFTLSKVGNMLLETASMTNFDHGLSTQWVPSWDDSVNITPIISRMGSNDFVVLSTTNTNARSGNANTNANAHAASSSSFAAKATAPSKQWWYT